MLPTLLTAPGVIAVVSTRGKYGPSAKATFWTPGFTSLNVKIPVLLVVVLIAGSSRSVRVAPSRGRLVDASTTVPVRLPVVTSGSSAMSMVLVHGAGRIRNDFPMYPLAEALRVRLAPSFIWSIP